MSFIDGKLVFWDNKDFAASGTTLQSFTADGFFDMLTSDGTIVNGATEQQLGNVYWNTIIGTLFTGMVAGYLLLTTSDAVGFNSSEETIASIGSAADPYAAADWVKGKIWSIQVPVKRLKQFLQVELVCTTQASAGKLDSYLGMEPLCPQNIQKFPT